MLLRSADREFVRWLPGGYRAVGSGGKGNAAACPWVAVFDPDETDTAQHGMYVVYLFAVDMTTVMLSLNHGVTEIGQRMGRRAAREALQIEAATIRANVTPETIADLAISIDLKSKMDLPVDYMYGNIVARIYDLKNLPSEEAMQADLRRFLRIYAAAIEARTEARQRGDAGIVSAPPGTKSEQRPGDFKPKNESDYVQMLGARNLVKSRKHEILVNEYADFLRSHQFDVASPHPRDLTADRNHAHWLFEAKTVGANPEHAAREALAQLYFYARFLYPHDVKVNKVALFNEDIGGLFVRFFEELDIAVVWKDGASWHGSPRAQEYELC